MIRKTSDDFNLTDDELIATITAVDTAGAEDMLGPVGLAVLDRMLSEAKKRGLHHRELVDVYTAMRIDGAE